MQAVSVINLPKALSFLPPLLPIMSKTTAPKKGLLKVVSECVLLKKLMNICEFKVGNNYNYLTVKYISYREAGNEKN